MFFCLYSDRKTTCDVNLILPQVVLVVDTHPKHTYATLCCNLCYIIPQNHANIPFLIWKGTAEKGGGADSCEAEGEGLILQGLKFIGRDVALDGSVCGCR